MGKWEREEVEEEGEEREEEEVEVPTTIHTPTTPNKLTNNLGLLQLPTTLLSFEIVSLPS